MKTGTEIWLLLCHTEHPLRWAFHTSIKCTTQTDKRILTGGVCDSKMLYTETGEAIAEGGSFHRLRKRDTGLWGVSDCSWWLNMRWQRPWSQLQDLNRTFTNTALAVKWIYPNNCSIKLNVVFITPIYNNDRLKTCNWTAKTRPDLVTVERTNPPNTKTCAAEPGWARGSNLPPLGSRWSEGETKHWRAEMIQHRFFAFTQGSVAPLLPWKRQREQLETDLPRRQSKDECFALDKMHI